MYIYSSDSDSVVAECIYTSKTAAMIAVSDITTSAVVAADLYIYMQNLHNIRVLLRDRLHAQPMPDDSWLLHCARCEEDLAWVHRRLVASKQRASVRHTFFPVLACMYENNA